MIAVDTNVLVRFLTADDVVQYARARKFMERHRTTQGEAPLLFVPALVACEVAWVLGTVHSYPRDLIGMAIRGLLDSRDLMFEERETVEAALGAFQSGRGDFADYFILEAARSAGCDSVATFDKKLHEEKGFRAP